MGQLIEYYIPEKFVSQQEKWVSPADRGKVLEFARTTKANEAGPTAAATLQGNWVGFAPTW